MIITLIEHYWFMEYTVNLYLQNNYQNYSEKWLSLILFLLCGLKYFVALYGAHGPLLARYLKEKRIKIEIDIFGKDSSLTHIHDSNCFDVIGGKKGFNSAFCIFD